jgi:hypothetical protein
MSAMIDPFQAAPDPELYVPRRASERAVTEFERGLFQTLEAVVVLVGPPGIGKSVVLAEVARRLDGRCTCVTVDFAGLPLPELCKWVLRELEAGESGGDAGGPGSPIGRLRNWMRRGPTRERDPEGALVQRALELERTGRPLVVLIDDADEMDGRTAAALAKLAGRAQGALFIGIATCDDRLLASAGKRSVAVSLTDPMSPDETARYISARLDRAGASRELRGRLDRDCVAKLHAYAQGNPRRVHGEISLIQIDLESQRQRAAGLLSEPAPAAAATAPRPAPVAPPLALAPARPAEGAPAPATPPAEPPQTLLSAPALAPMLPSRVTEPVLEPALPLADPPLLATPVARDADLPAAPSRSEEAEGEESSKGVGLLLVLLVVAGVVALGWYAGTFLDSARATSGEREGSDTAEVAPAEPATPAPRAEVPSPSKAVWVTVNINADPWANVWVDGRLLGDTPLADVPLAMGEHRFRAVFEDGKFVERTIDVNRENRFLSFP